MYTKKIFRNQKSTYLFASAEVSPALAGLGELGGSSTKQKLRAIIGREIATNFGVGSEKLKIMLATAVDDILRVIGDDEKTFFLGLVAKGGLGLNGDQMVKSRGIILGERDKISTLDILLKNSPVL